MTLHPTLEQTVIRNAALSTSNNLLISARAGAAKTTTLILISEALPEIDILAIAFNKKIADELRERLPANAESATMNALGHRAWKGFTGKHPKVDARKNYFLLKEIIDELPEHEREDAYENFSDLLQSIATAKTEGYMPGKLHPAAKPLISDDSFFDLIEFECSDFHQQLINEFMRRNFALALQGKIDFDDQIYCAALMPCSFPSPSLTLIDEAQDLSHINHVILRKIVKQKRLIAVGDECQAIYGFRGASENSMNELCDQFNMDELPLTICFRSSQAVVENARWRAPDMQFREGAPLGLIENLQHWSSADILDGDAIICRNNAPLFSMAVQLIKAGRNPELSSGDIIKQIEKLFSKLGKDTRSCEEAHLALTTEIEKVKAKRRDKSRINDLEDCIRVILDQTETLSQARAFFQSITSRTGRIKLMTGHKSKGLEFNRVWFLDRQLLQSKGQDLNIRYVIETRARESLFYVESQGWKETQ